MLQVHQKCLFPLSQIFYERKLHFVLALNTEFLSFKVLGTLLDLGLKFSVSVLLSYTRYCLEGTAYKGHSLNP